jgi:hypothetical protein
MGRLQYQINVLRETVLDALDAQFGLVPHKMSDQIRMIEQLEMLKSLFKQAMRCPDRQSLKKQLSSWAV